jgi:hypothetical protein
MLFCWARVSDRAVFGVGVNGDDAVALALKVLRYPVAVALLPG